MRNRRRPYRDDEDDDLIGETLAAVNDRLDDLSLQIARIARRTQTEERGAARRFDHDDRDSSVSIGKALEQFNRRLDQIVGGLAPRTDSSRTHADWLPDFDRAPEDERGISREPARSAAAPRAAATAESAQDLSGLEDQLRKITEQIAALHQPCRIDDAVTGLRMDLAAISRSFNEAMPRQAIEVLEKEVRALAERIDRSREPGVDTGKLGMLEHGIAEVRDTLRNLEPAENLVEIGKAVNELARKIDQISTANQSPAALQKLDQVIAGLRGIVAHVASNDAVGKLAAEVRNLAAKVDSAAAESGSQAIGNLDQRVASLEAGRGAPPDGAMLIQAVGEQVDQRIQPLIEASRAAAHNSEALVHAVAEELDQRLAALPQSPQSPAPDGNMLVRAVADELEHRIAAHFEAVRQSSPDPETLIRALGDEIEQRFAALADADQPAAPALAAQVKALADKLDRIQLSQGDKIALTAIEDRIVQLAVKLDESGAWLGRLDAIERGVADLMVYVDDLRQTRPVRSAETSPAPEPELRPHARQLARAEPERASGAVQPAERHRQAIGGMADLPTVETAIHAPAQPTVPVAEPELAEANFAAPEHAIAAAPARPAADTAPVDALVAALEPLTPPRDPIRRPIDPDLPPDTPIEPSQETSQVRASAAERISASEAALGGAKPVAREVASQFETLIAARRAAFAASAEASAAAPAGQSADKSASAGTARLRTYLRWVLLVASVIIIVLGAVKVGMDMWGSSDTTEAPLPAVEQSGSGSTEAPVQGPGTNAAPSEPQAPVQRNTPAMPLPGEPIPVVPPEETPLNPPASGSSSGEPLDGATNKPMPEVTGALPRQQQDPARTSAELPASLAGPALRAAAAAGNPAAEYEIAVRYADGRGVTANLEESARWLERAARAGFAPAQFRLASLYDKGGGLKRDRSLARQLYTAAAEKGHAKAMHNLAVLYAEGIDGKPNYRMAAHWFRKAAEHGIADSQYNLAILYIRGIGIEQNLAEAYKWFALAANQGDQEAARKREEVAERLDEPALGVARQMVQSFVVTPQPAQAISLRTPPGGWDRANVETQQPARPKQRPATPDAQGPKSLLSPQPL